MEVGGGGCVVVCVRGMGESEGGGCTRKQSSFVLTKSGLTGVRIEPRLERGKKT